MKIRIRDNSVRLRLTRGEVDKLQQEGRVRSVTGFPAGREFAYCVESSPASISATASYAENSIVVLLPETQVLAWATTEQVSIRDEQRLDDGAVLDILVEKDFACLAPRGEDESDNFPHPEADKGGC